MTVSTTTVQQQLRAILALTNTEIQIAETRQAQARTDAIRKELTQNAQNARERAASIEAALRERGGLIDVISPVLGRVVAAAKTFAEQTQPLDEALLDDLALEQRLVARATYLKALATGQEDAALVDLADRLIDAHTATVHWLTTVLAEEALGGPTALRRGPTQWVSGVAARAITAPAIGASWAIDRTAEFARQIPDPVETLRNRFGRAVDDAAETASRAGDAVSNAGTAVSKTVAAGRDAALEAVEESARDNGAKGTADALHQLREVTGTVEAEELPIDGYVNLNVADAVAAVKELTKPADLRVTLAYEEAHKNRQRVVSAIEIRFAQLAKELVGIDN
ncbi:ferritin-like domain-containing protein [Gordonia jinghuaiqii]|uniref:Ferritin-like domain-containing protein n=1 Tax=Gordonia jinghuaiqii TaxID=2758710 RepID=A0A7D7QNW4_9ACTN|nr:ferritin-like domain-containing protein [Gordonia jinghuaiqii]MCR5979257.1 ferritin-like domain-containing protein [Gordonia jinghuaiqii]QMT01046.1 ferritin-like domain-containing protein [Gordonia jinghuaiqii]